MSVLDVLDAYKNTVDALSAQEPQPHTRGSTESALTVKDAAAKLGAVVERYSGNTLPLSELNALVQLTHDNMEGTSTKAALERTKAELQHSQTTIVLVKLPLGRLIGFIAYRLRVVESWKATTYNYELQIVEDFRGNGLGTALIAEAEDASWRCGPGFVMLSCSALNSANKFYEKTCGYDCVSTREEEDANREKVTINVYGAKAKPPPAHRLPPPAPSPLALLTKRPGLATLDPNQIPNQVASAVAKRTKPAEENEDNSAKKQKLDGAPPILYLAKFVRCDGDGEFAKLRVHGTHDSEFHEKWVYQDESVEALEAVVDGTTTFVKIRDPRGDEGYVREGYLVRNRKRPH
jgi:GNAT superfamily N-acetyltransferase